MNQKCLQILQEKEYEMLKKIDIVLRKNGIEYFLACGTLLGAVRHSGFIPWDDDVDIYIWGKDYDKAKNLLKNNSMGIEWHDFDTKQGYPYTFPKIVACDTKLIERSMNNCGYQGGVYIDVFPLTTVSDNKVIRLISELRRRVLYSVIRLYYAEFKSLYRNLLKCVVRLLVNPSRVQMKLKKIYTRDIKGTKYVLDSGVFGNHALLKINNFQSHLSHSFIDKDFWIPEGYDEYLSTYYGDYMQLPREDKRVSEHEILILEIDNRKIK